MKFDKTYIEGLTEEMTNGPFVRFMDMHSGGIQNTAYGYILIQANYEEAIAVFGARFGQNPESVNCSCCGGNYSVREDDDLYQLTGYDRNLESDKDSGGYLEGVGKDMRRYGGKIETPIPLIVYLNEKDICIIFASEIKPEERESWNIPEASYPYESSYDEDDD
jgi:hypothetical protein